MKKIIIFILVLQAGLLFAQQDLSRLTEMQKIFFVSEASGLASTSYNPAAMSMRADNNGVILGYDFDEFNIQGNSSVFLTSNNIGISYQDVYSINNVRLQNYSVNISVGNEYFSIGTTNRYTLAKYPLYNLDQFSFDAGIIFKPASFISFGFLARNLSEIKLDSLNYVRNYTAGIGLIFFDEALRLYADADFKDNAKFDDLSGTLGVVISPLNLFEFRGGLVLNPNDILSLREDDLNITELSDIIIINLKYEAFVSASFLIKDTIRATAAARFNDVGERTRFSIVFGFPLSRAGY